MHTLATKELVQLLAKHMPPCISLYQPTHRHHPESHQGPVRYRNLVDKVEKALSQGFPAREYRPLLEKFESLKDDEWFWRHRTEGLAVVGCPGLFQIFDLQRAVPELYVVSDSFHVKPLLRYVQSAERFQVLCLDRREVKLFEGNRYALDEVEIPQVLAAISAQLGEVPAERPLTAGAARTIGPAAGVGRVRPAVFYGHGARTDQTDLDAERFFRVVDKAIIEHHSRPSGHPLILAALPENQAIFRTVSRNTLLLGDGIKLDPDSLSMERLRKRAWEVMEPWFKERTARYRGEFKAAKNRGMGTDDLQEAARAAFQGRVGRVLIDAERHAPGKINPVDGSLLSPSRATDLVDDVLDDLAEMILRTDGEVVVLPTHAVPSKTGVAAVFRY